MIGTKETSSNSGGFINTRSGKQVRFLLPTADMICLEDIITGLSNVCRWGGQIESHFSVAQHTLLVWYLTPEELKPVALMHDAAEAYLGDVTKPLKNLLGSAYSGIESEFNSLIFNKYGLDINDLPLIKQYDQQANAIEHDYFFKGKLEFIQKFYEINELVEGKKPKNQLSLLMKEQFLEIEFNSVLS